MKSQSTIFFYFLLEPAECDRIMTGIRSFGFSHLEEKLKKSGSVTRLSIKPDRQKEKKSLPIKRQ
jgi:hypothetical protein